LVTQVTSNWNLILSEIVQWYDYLRGGTQLISTPSVIETVKQTCLAISTITVMK